MRIEDQGRIGDDYAPTRRGVMVGVAAAALATSPVARAAARRRPNIVFIMADDLGYADLSCYGRRDYRTPALDALASRGIRFTSAYSNSPVCSATRTALITGRYQYRLAVGLEEPLAFRDVGLSPAVPTLASQLRAAGYRTALVGKWHLGQLPSYGPLKSGYERFWGFRGGGVDYFTHDFAGKPDLWDGDIPIEQAGYLTNLLGDRAISTIEEWGRDDQPFLLSLHFSAPHWPWEGPNDQAESGRLAKEVSLGALLHHDGGSLKTYAEMVTSLDRQVGRVVATLERLGIIENTIIVFTSDNGGERFGDTWPFSGRKSELLEGGIRVPTLLTWPGRIAPDVSDVPIMTMDWMPTLLAAAGEIPSRAAPSDGLNLMAGTRIAAPADRPLYWRYKALDQRALRVGSFKYLRIADNEFLFDVVADPLERANLKQREPQRFADLKSRWEAWNATMLPYDARSISAVSPGRDVADRPGVAPTLPPPPGR